MIIRLFNHFHVPPNPKNLYNIIRCYTSFPIQRLLIANRGEIACRIARTAKSLGIKTIGVHSEADRASLHVKTVDESYLIGGASPLDSYLNGNKVIEAAERSGAQAIHPGYGFLSENAEFAEKCALHNLIFVGPPASAIREMGLKNRAKSLMSAAGVPVIIGYHGDDQSDHMLKEEAEKIGFPVMLKAVRGGGGKGMRIVKNVQQFNEQLESARHESLKAFGDGAMIVEKFLENPRHVEVQIFGDSHANYVYLFERDCSVQRRHQKIVEEAPAPGIGAETRREIGEAAKRAAAAVNYVGAGTVEFVMDAQQKFYFMEMNTRLQVEHPITEMITGFDLVEWQLRVAAGERLPISDQNLITLKGHSFEARIYAEDPDENFMPGAGHIPYLNVDQSLVKDEQVRIETGIVEGDTVSVHYDPMIAKLVAWAPNRQLALEKLGHVLGNYEISGIKTNVSFLKRLIKHDSFKAGDVHTNFIAHHYKELFPAQTTVNKQHICKLAIASALFEDYSNLSTSNDPFDLKDCFRINLDRYRLLKLRQGSLLNMQISLKYLNNDEYDVSVDQNEPINCKILRRDFQSNQNRQLLDIMLEIDNTIMQYRVVKVDDHFTLFEHGESIDCMAAVPDFVEKMTSSNESSSANDSTAPMPGLVEKILVAPGQNVEATEPLVVMVAMKMEYVIRAPKKCQIEAVLCKVGDSVAKGAHLVSFVTS